MNTEYRSGFTTAVIGISTLCLVGIVACMQAEGVFIGWVMFFFAFIYIAITARNFLKYRLTNDSIQQINWTGRVTGAVYYTEIKQAFLHKDYGNVTRSGRSYSENEYLLFVLIDGTTIRFDTTDIDESEELLAALMAKIESE